MRFGELGSNQITQSLDKKNGLRPFTEVKKTVRLQPAVDEVASNSISDQPGSFGQTGNG